MRNTIVTRRRALAAMSTLLALLVLSGCDSSPTEVRDYDPQPVLTAYLMRGDPVREVYLQRVAPLVGFYDPREHGIVGAEVVVTRIDVPDTLRLCDDPQERGHYVAEDTTWVPVGKGRYRIHARFGTEHLWAETVVPDSFDLEVLPRPVAGDTLTRNDPPIVLSWSASDSAGGYAFNVMSLAPEDSLIPLDPDFDPEDAEDDTLTQSAGWVMRSDQRVQTIPWIIFRWVGPYRMSVMAVTKDYYDYAFAWMRISGGVEMVPPTNINGGLGIFAGFSRHQFEFCMKPAGQ